MRAPTILGVLVLGALALRLVAVGDPLSHDEGYTWLVTSAGGAGTFFDRLAAFENTPPLYYVLTWPLPDDGVAWLRLVSVLAGAGCVAAVWWTTRSWIAAAAMAVAPFAVSYSDYARGFVLADLGLIIALGAAMKGRWGIYVAGAAVALYAEYDSALFLIAIAIACRNWRLALPIALLIPWLPFVEDTDTKVAPIYPDPGLGSLRDTIVRLTFGEHGTATAIGLRWLQFLLVAVVLVWAFRRAPRIVWVTAAWTLTLHAVAHWFGPDVFAPRYLTELIPLGAIAVGAAIDAAATRPIRAWMPRVAAVAMAALAVAIAVQRSGDSDEPDYPAIAKLVARGAEGRTVLTNSAVVAYYMRDLEPRLDRPFGLGPGLESGCVADCKVPFLIVDDARVANSPRTGPGQSHSFGPIYVRATPQVAGGASVDSAGDMGSLACSLALLVASSLGGVGTAHPMEVTVQDDALLLHRPPAEVQRTARRLADLGADRLRVTAGWSVLEPERDKFSDGTLRALDTAVKTATAAGLKVQIDLAFWAPKWAVARKLRRKRDAGRQRWRPDPVAFGQFAEKIAKRYDGNFADPTSKKNKPLPAVRLWTTWNEPNHPSFLLPQSERTRSGGWRDVAPHVYRAMHEAAYNSLKGVDEQNKVLIGGLSSRGASAPGPTRNIPPLRFIRRLACLDDQLQPLRDPACRDFHPLQADGFAYHPYSFEAAPDVAYGGPDTAHLADLDRLSRLLEEIHKRGRASSAFPLYLTEFGYESNPPDTRRGVPPDTQARYTSLASFLAWRSPNTQMFAQFLLQDIADPRSYQTGLLYPDGRDKPALQAFKLPFWAQAHQAGAQSYVLAWGQVRPRSGSQAVALEVQKPDGTWHTVPSFSASNNADGKGCPTEDEQFMTDEYGFYLRALPYDGVLSYRARWVRPDGGADYAPPVTVGLPSAS